MSRDTTKLVHIVKILALEHVKRAAVAGFNIKITDCYRTQAEQDALDPSVTTVKYPYSLHCYGLAYDICQDKKDDPYPKDLNWWKAVAKVAQRMGLEWGGEWTEFTDRPHFQFSGFGSTGKQVVNAVGYPATFEKNIIQKRNQLYLPEKGITKNSIKADILWFQWMLNLAGCTTEYTGKLDNQTIESWYSFRMVNDGKYVKGGSMTVGGLKILQSRVVEILGS